MGCLWHSLRTPNVKRRYQPQTISASGIPTGGLGGENIGVSECAKYGIFNKKYKKIWGGARPLPTRTPNRLGICSILTPPILKS